MQPFPELSAKEMHGWDWPAPPFPWRHLPSSEHGPWRCRIETRPDVSLEGDLIEIDAPAGLLSFRMTPDGAAVTVPFARFCRLTLTEPLIPMPPREGAMPERVPAAAQERDYRVVLARDGGELTGRTLGRVEDAHALYLYAPVDEDRAVHRMLLPRAAVERCEFGDSVEEVAARAWLATPEALLAALRGSRPLLRIGEALLQLGFVTPAQIERAQAQEGDTRPLGERLVAAGVLSRADLQTAFGHKMGVPLVDLERFPFQPELLALLPPRIAIASRALPLLRDGPRLVVAVDRLARLEKLKPMRVFAGVEIVPVLASRRRILRTLERINRWSVTDFGVGGFVDTDT